MFLIILNYVKPIEQIDALLPSHADFLDACYRQGKFIVSGRRNPRSGGVILANSGSREEIWELLRQDPFYINGAAEYEVIEFMPTKYDSRFECFVR